MPLTPVDIELDGIAGRDGFYGAGAAAMSPDGRHLYVAASTSGISPDIGDNDVAVFERDVATGALTFVGTHPLPVRARVFGVVVSADGRHLYLAMSGSYVFSVQPFTRDVSSGALSPLGGLVVSGGPGTEVSDDRIELFTSPDDRFLYAGWEQAYLPSGSSVPMGVAARDLTSGLLSPIDSPAVSSGARAPMAISPDGRHLYVAEYNQWTGRGRPLLKTLNRDPESGRLASADTLLDVLIRPYLPHQLDMRSVVLSPDGQFIFVYGNDYVTYSTVAVLRRDPGSGRAGLVDRALFNNVFSPNRRSAVVRPDGALVVMDAWRGGVYTWRQERHCAPTPLAGCRRPLTPGRSTIEVQKRAASPKSKVTWKWTNGAVTEAAAFGDPTTATGHTLCVYDGGAAPQPLLDMRMPPGARCVETFSNPSGIPCWASTTTGFRWTNRERMWDGIRKATLAAGPDGYARILVKADGVTIPFPPTFALPFTAPVRVQLQADNGQCWEATYSTPTRNDTQQFKATSD